MTRDQALLLLHEHVKNPNLIKHMLAAEALMHGLAKKLGEDDPSRLGAASLVEAEEKWGLAGLLHDLDYEQTRDAPEQHSLVAYKLLKKTDLDPEATEAIKVHNDRHGFEPKTLLEKALFCAESLTGLVVACALVQPDKKLASVTSESVLKKFKSKSFAAGAKRELIARCQELIGISLEELVDICLLEMKKIAGELEL